MGREGISRAQVSNIPALSQAHQLNTSSLSILASTNDLNHMKESFMERWPASHQQRKAEAGLKNPCLEALNVSGLEIFVAVILQRWLRSGLRESRLSLRKA